METEKREETLPSTGKSLGQLKIFAVSHFAVGALLWIFAIKIYTAGQFNWPFLGLLFIASPLSAIGFGGFFLPKRRIGQHWFVTTALRYLARLIQLSFVPIALMTTFDVTHWDWLERVAQVVMIGTFLLAITLESYSLRKRLKKRKTEKSDNNGFQTRHSEDYPKEGSTHFWQDENDGDHG